MSERGIAPAAVNETFICVATAAVVVKCRAIVKPTDDLANVIVTVGKSAIGTQRVIKNCKIPTAVDVTMCVAIDASIATNDLASVVDIPGRLGLGKQSVDCREGAVAEKEAMLDLVGASIVSDDVPSIIDAECFRFSSYLKDY